MPKKSRKTRQKEAIGAAAKNIGGLFTAYELCSAARSADKSIGKATVYRFLKNLSEEGRLHAYSCGKNKIYSSQAVNHCHFICRKCGKTEHFEPKKVDFLKGMTSGKPCHFQLDVHGICTKCLENGS